MIVVVGGFQHSCEVLADDAGDMNSYFSEKRQVECLELQVVRQFSGLVWLLEVKVTKRKDFRRADLVQRI